MAADGMSLLLPYFLTTRSTPTILKVPDSKEKKKKILAMRMHRVLKRHRLSRKRNYIVLFSLWCSILATVPRPRSIWCVERSQHWWDYVVMSTFKNKDWLENFRLSKSTFMHLCDQLRPYIQHQDTRFRKCISVERRVGITLWCPATCGEYRSIGHLFGVARVDEVKAVVNGFKIKFGMIQCLGSIDGSHIPVMPPALNHTDYYNRKGYYSMILQAVVDHNYVFRDINIRWPGSVHDARVFVNSSLYHKAINREILTGNELKIDDKVVPLFLIGDSAYPLSSWLMKPFAHNTELNDSERKYNYYLSKSRIVVENAFGRLKARWRRLLKRNDMMIDNVPYVVSACCILHNVCEVHGEAFIESWMQGVDTSNQPTTSQSRTVLNNNAKEIRNTLVDYFKNMP
ncbi:PREDICTED: protein ANTAGONIST OF LIKE HETEROCHROMATIN PROTEIN 1-like [Amphimedon queenslandica]|uniref:DDE Tnp4 domain-containing protein n=1 Tax=Amphimedon queenslandica TaxID=400682 RepID=A0A1X7U052_AMPQE|nr:PREDICTED: protein ANTAGONIST OF LIKE HETEROCHROMATIN PROTEIN 1-like [Amphimedon queenslandica]|eukprot:XP_003389375.1 PREDICTED: protein ANTAGONIST OF LIKE HETEROCHROMATIN PROTEIN 1-like [Amphimedon queenslandica]